MAAQTVVDIISFFFKVITKIGGKVILPIIRRMKKPVGGYPIITANNPLPPLTNPHWGQIFGTGKGNYNLKQSLVTPTEDKFLKILERVVRNRYRIFPQMQLSRMMDVRIFSRGDFNRIAMKSVDFILCDQKLKPCIAIELDDVSHLRLDRIQRDRFVDKVMTQIGLRIIHVPVAAMHDEARLESLIFLPYTNSTGSFETRNQSTYNPNFT